MKGLSLKKLLKVATTSPAPALRIGHALFNDWWSGKLKLRAASLSYTTLLYFVPLLAVCFSVLKGFGVHNQMEPFLQGFLAPLGDHGSEIAVKIVRFVDNINVGVLGAVGLGVLIYGVIAVMVDIEMAFNDIWGIKRGRPVLHRIKDYLGILFVGSLLMLLSMAMTGAFQHEGAIEKILGIQLPTGALESGLTLLSLLLFVLSFTSFYMFMPNTPVKPLPALAAGLLATVLWKTMGWLFRLFIAGSASYAVIYSAFAALLVFMIWIYAGWTVILIGASMSCYLQNYKRLEAGSLKE